VLGFLGIFLARNNIILILICIELILLSVNIFFVVFSLYLDDLLGYIFAFLILTVAAAESAIGLAILIVFYRIMQDIRVDSLFDIKA
jgi:NADH-quinone oxidoreductase subunit K